MEITTRDYTTLHLDINASKINSDCIAVLHFTVAVDSSTLSKTQTLR